MVGTTYYLTIWPPLTTNLQSIWKKTEGKKRIIEKEYKKKIHQFLMGTIWCVYV
jgi:hypothetical protein